MQKSEEKFILVKPIRKDFASRGRIWIRFCRMGRIWIEGPVNTLWLERWFPDVE